MTLVLLRATWYRRQPAPETSDPGMVLRSLDVGAPRVHLATPMGVVGLVGVRSVIAGTVDNCVPFVLGLLIFPATTCSFLPGLSFARLLGAPHGALPPSLPGLVWVPPPLTPTRDIRRGHLALPCGGSMAAAPSR